LVSILTTRPCSGIELENTGSRNQNIRTNTKTMSRQTASQEMVLEILWKYS